MANVETNKLPYKVKDMSLADWGRKEIKIAEKQELEDYKAQCRKLETEIEELEAERTQLRYRLRQYNTLYSNKG